MENWLTGSVRKETAISDTTRTSVQNWHNWILLQDLLRSRMWKMHRETEVPEEEVQVGKWFDGRARITSKELAPLHVKSGILRSACSTSPKMDANLLKSALLRIARLKPSKRSQQNGDRMAVAILKSTRQLGCVFMAPDMPKPIRRAKIHKSCCTPRQIRDQNPSLGIICPSDPYQHNPNAPKFEDRSQKQKYQSDVESTQ